MSIKPTKRPSVHPGEILADYINDHALSQSEVARRLRVPIGNINEICRKKRGISPEMAFKLARLFRTTPDLWMNLQSSWEMSQVDIADINYIEPIRRSA